MLLSIRSNGENVDIYLRNNFNYFETLVNTITVSYLKKGTNLSPYENLKNSLFERLLLLLFLCYTKNLLVLTVHHPLQTYKHDDPTTNPPSSEVKVKTCKLFDFLFIRTNDLFTKFLCKYIKFKFKAMLSDESCIFQLATRSRLRNLALSYIHLSYYSTSIILHLF